MIHAPRTDRHCVYCKGNIRPKRYGPPPSICRKRKCQRLYARDRKRVQRSLEVHG